MSGARFAVPLPEENVALSPLGARKDLNNIKS